MTPLLLAAALTFAQVPAPTAPLTPADAPPSAPTPQRSHLLRRARTLDIAGATVLIVSAGFWSFTISAMVGGNRNANRYNEIAAEVNLVPRPLDEHERDQLASITRNGVADNRYAIAGGVTAGVLTVIGAALLGRARLLRRSARKMTPLVLPRGLGVGWHLQF